MSSGLLAVYCPQEADKAPDALTDFALDFGREARSLRERLNLTDDMPWRWNELSFGERKKLQIACALWQRPDALAIDEPTNHLDHAAHIQLERLLAGYSGIGILVSHDRELLGALVDRCASFEPAGPKGGMRIVVRPGGYSTGHMQAERERAAATGERKRAKDELARLAAEREQRAREADRGRVLSCVAQLNSDPDRILEGAASSPGELRKLMIARELLDAPALIIMDEPTNHLDLHSVEALEQALAQFAGALLLVSHDRAFLQACTNITWEIDGSTLKAH